MRKIILCSIMGLSIAMFVFETSPAYAIFGIRAARAAIAARKAREMTSSSSPEEVQAQGKEKFETPARAGEGTKSDTSKALKDKETL